MPLREAPHLEPDTDHAHASPEPSDSRLTGPHDHDARQQVAHQICATAATTTRQEVFRVPGYTSSAPWLRALGPPPADNRSLRPRTRRASTGSTVGQRSQAGRDVLLGDLSRASTIILPNPYGQPPLPLTTESESPSAAAFSRSQRRQRPRSLPQVAISESRLILNGVDVYADLDAPTKNEPTNEGGSDVRDDPVHIIPLVPPEVPSLPTPDLNTTHPTEAPRQPSIPPFITTQPSPHPAPSASTSLTESKPELTSGTLLPLTRGEVDHRNSKNVPVNPDGTRDWSSDICMFCDHNLGGCLQALVCPSVVYAQNKARLEQLNLARAPRKTPCRDVLDNGASNEVEHKPRFSVTYCAAHVCLTAICLGWVLQVFSRSATRKRYNIEGDFMGDCAASLCCSACELAQENREIMVEERSYDDV